MYRYKDAEDSVQFRQPKERVEDRLNEKRVPLDKKAKLKMVKVDKPKIPNKSIQAIEDMRMGDSDVAEMLDKSKLINTFKNLRSVRHSSEVKPRDGKSTKSKSLTQITPVPNIKSRPYPTRQNDMKKSTEIMRFHGPGRIPPSLLGEKLLTVGGYIVSLQSKLDKIAIGCTLKSKVSSDNDGLELEIKITGCLPSEIKFEKRYNAIIVVGVAAPGASNELFGGVGSTTGSDRSTALMPSSNDLMLPIIKSLSKTKDLLPFTYLHDDLNEVVNIFVPKHVSLADVIIYKPDAQGRFMIKGP